MWVFVLFIWIVVIAIPNSRAIFMKVTESHPYIGGFVYKAIVWGLLGVMITLVFTVFTSGAAMAQTAGRLPFAGSKLAQAFFGSTIMNLTFGPMMYIYHKFGDLYIDAKYENNGGSVSIKELVDKVDWYNIVSFSWLKTCPLIWIPCHTIVFLLPDEYRVLASAFLSILLGILIAISKKSNEKTK